MSVTDDPLQPPPAPQPPPLPPDLVEAVPEPRVPRLQGVTPGRVWRFVVRVVRHFRDNKGLLLAGGIAYNSLLSILPLSAVMLVMLSHVVEEAILLQLISSELHLLVPGQAETLMVEIAAFLDNRELFGGVGLVVMLFFSSLAFRMLDDAMAVIFARAPVRTARPGWLSLALPYIYMGVMAIGLTAITAALAVLSNLGDMSLLGVTWTRSEVAGWVVYVCGLISEALMFTSVYTVMPEGHVRFRRALIGGITATVLWEMTRYIMTWYFTHVSLVSVIYGSLATVVVGLLMLEVAAIIVLLGAQVIAELEHSAEANLPWYSDPTPHDHTAAQPPTLAAKRPTVRPDPNTTPRTRVLERERPERMH